MENRIFSSAGKDRMLLFFYHLLWTVAFFLSVPFLWLLRNERMAERLALTLPDRLPRDGPLWIHALSVGEVLSAVALVGALKEAFRDFELFFSVSTQTGFEIAQSRLSDQVQAVFFFPYDLYFSVRRAVNTVGPDLVVMVETDAWPNFLFALNSAGVPAVLVNARISDKSFKNYKRLSYFSQRLFARFTKICAQSNLDAVKFKNLGIPAHQVVMTGNIKFDQKFVPMSRGEKAKLKHMLHLNRQAKIFVAGSTHNGEEAILRDAFIQMKKRFSDLMLVIVPRDPKRAGQVRELFKEAGVASALVSDLNAAGSRDSVDVVVVDTIGLLDRLYELADIAFIGGSLVGSGGHNPLEAAACALPILFGPDMTDFKEVSRMLLDAGGAVVVKDVGDLVQVVDTVLGESGQAALMGRCAHDVFCGNQGAVAKTLEVIRDTVRYR